MTLLIIGLLLWSGAHFFKRVAPDLRASMGNRGRGLVAVLSVLAIVLMVIGYRSAQGPIYWGRTPAMTGINNLAVLFAFYLFAASAAKTRITRFFRHPQLSALIVWAGAHLLVNGALEDLVLFGGLGLWALAEMILLSRVAPAGPFHPVPVKKEITALIVTLVVFGVAATIHILLGVNPFG